MNTALRSRFLAGVYKPDEHSAWPHFHMDEGTYLSKKKRVCSHQKAAEFETATEARDFYASWNLAAKYRLHVVEYKKQVDVPPPQYDANHPWSILENVRRNETRSIYNTAFKWFIGEPITLSAKATFRKHRSALLPYGIELNEECANRLESLPSQDDHAWHLGKKPALQSVD